MSELRNLGYGDAIWLIQHNANFLGKLLLFLLAFVILMAGEFLLVTHLNQSYRLKHPVAAPLATVFTPLVNPPMPKPSIPPEILLRQALWLSQQNQLDPALSKVNDALQSEPNNPDAYILRGHIYAGLKRWDDADRDFKRVIALIGDDPQANFDLAEVQFMQQNYDVARTGFAALEKNSYIGDLALYKVFLCDLFGGHEDAASKNLQAFDAVGANASYYFANAAWDLYHHRTKEARGWLASAANIYSPDKFEIYSSSLTAHGYLPLPPEF